MEAWKFILIVLIFIAFPLIFLTLTYASIRNEVRNSKAEKDEINRYPSARKYKRWSDVFQSVFVVTTLPDAIMRSTVGHSWPPKPYYGIVILIQLFSGIGFVVAEILKRFEIRRARSMANADLSQE